MTLFNRNPLGCHDVNELQQWVVVLQDSLVKEQNLNDALREKNDLLRNICAVQDELNDHLRERGKLLKERIAQHESGAVHNHQLRQN